MKLQLKMDLNIFIKVFLLILKSNCSCCILYSATYSKRTSFISFLIFITI